MFALVLFGSPGLTSGAFFYVGGIPVVGVWERYAHAPRCLGRDIIMEGHHEQAQCDGIIVGAALLSAAPFSLQWSQKNVALSLDSADARVGRPLTATSVAGVNRRVHRRAYRRGYYYY